jgi:hypothetical protein
MKRLYTKHVTKCSECPAHQIVRKKVTVPSLRCDEYHLEIAEKDADTFPMFCELRKVQ